ncbi:unnamed protein product [Camellia sinensis]
MFSLSYIESVTTKPQTPPNLTSLQTSVTRHRRPRRRRILTGYGGDDLYTELWKACADPLVDVPRSGERVLFSTSWRHQQIRN